MLKIRTIKNAIKIGYWAYKNPLVLQAHNFKILSELFAMIMKVASENRPMMVHIGMVQLTETQDKAKMPPLVSIWAGAGSGAEPLKRIQELLSEIDLLKNTLAKANRDQQQQLPTIKKTALEWLFSQPESDLGVNLAVAKQMEIEQIKDAYGDGLNAHRTDFCNRHQYFDKMYKNEQ